MKKQPIWKTIVIDEAAVVVGVALALMLALITFGDIANLTASLRSSPVYGAAASSDSFTDESIFINANRTKNTSPTPHAAPPATAIPVIKPVKKLTAKQLLWAKRHRLLRTTSVSGK